MLIRGLTTFRAIYPCKTIQLVRKIPSSPSKSIVTLCQFENNYSILHRKVYHFSKQKIYEQFERLNQQIDIKLSLEQQNDVKQKQNQFLEKQQKIIKDFLSLTEQSFNQHLQIELKEKYHIDAEMLLMIISSLEDPNVIRQNLVKLYPFISIFQKSELLLLFELVLAYKPPTVPPLSTVQPKPLDSIESMLLLLSEIYQKQQKIIQWFKQIPLYKGKNICMVATGFFAIYEKMDQHLRFKNQKLINKCIDRIVHLAVDQVEQTKISIAILALQSPDTCHFAEQLLIEIQTIDLDQIDSLKLQLFFIYLQRHLASAYAQTRKQAKNKTKYKILQESEQGQLTEKEQQQYIFSPEDKQLQYSKISQIEKYKFLNQICKKTLIKIMDLDWKEIMKLNLLLDYWKILETFEGSYPWNSFQHKIITFTAEKEIVQKLTNLDKNQILTIVEVMEKLKINKSQLLLKCLALLSEQLDVLDSGQLIRLAKVCVTFVRQCQDFLISLRRQIQGRKFIFKDQQIDQLNDIFKRVLVLFPRPLVK